MRIKMEQIQRFFVAWTIFFFPFITSITKAPSFLGGLGKEGSFYPALCFFVLFYLSIFITKGKVFFPKKNLIICLLIFLIIALVSLVFNANDLLVVHHQGASGYGRAIVQYGSLCFYVLLAIAYSNFFVKQNDSLQFALKWIILSATLSATYSIFELGALFSDPTCLAIREFIDSLFRDGAESTGVIQTYLRGVRSLADEASFFALYSGIVFPWIFAGTIIYPGKKRYLFSFLLALFFMFNILSTSRTAYVVIAFEILACAILFKKYISFKKITSFMMVLLASFVIIYSNFSDVELLDRVDFANTFQSIFEEDKLHEGSNVARYGSQQAALAMFKEHPLLGVGYGEFGFYAADYYPNSAWQSFEVLDWGSNVVPGKWPPTHNFFARLLGETGILGFLAWITFSLIILIEIYRIKRHLSAQGNIIMSALFISFLAIFIFSLQNDSIRIMPLWLFIGLVWGVSMHVSKS